MNLTTPVAVESSVQPKAFSLWWLVALGIVSAVFSVSMFFWQAVQHTDQASGKIVTIMDTNVMIIDARGTVTTIQITPTTKIHLAPRSKATASGPLAPTNMVTSLSIGQFVHVFGVRDATGQLIGNDIRVMRSLEPKGLN